MSEGQLSGAFWDALSMTPTRRHEACVNGFAMTLYARNDLDSALKWVYEVSWNLEVWQ